MKKIEEKADEDKLLLKVGRGLTVSGSWGIDYSSFLSMFYFSLCNILTIFSLENMDG